MQSDASEPGTGVAVIVLAAGGSARMGQPKQLLRVDGESLIRRAAKTALASRCARVLVVVGAESGVVAREIEDLPVERVDNAHWGEGIASSIRAGVDAAATARPPADAVLITLADQPAVTCALLDQLIAAGETAPVGLVACEYGETLGAPALFARRHFEALRRLGGDRGGKALLTAHAEAVVRIRFDPAAIDVDTPEDYDRLLAAASPLTPPPPRRSARDRE
jgi:molybdenum cofactor cytidylyltransferase